MKFPKEDFEFEYTPTSVVYGRSKINQIYDKIEELNKNNALIVCGSNVGNNSETMEPIKSGLGDKLTAIFDKTTPEKYLNTVLDGVDKIHEEDIDIVICVGGGSSLNVGRAMCSVAPLELDRENIEDEVIETRKIPRPDDSSRVIPNIVIPTTLTGADISHTGSIFVDSDENSPNDMSSNRFDAQMYHPSLMPTHVIYDPELFETTPTTPLVGSIMNGFNKGIETLYSQSTTPIANAHSIQGLKYYMAGLNYMDNSVFEASVVDNITLGNVLVQYGRQSNIIHAFANGLAYHYDVQQGVAHAIVTPQVLNFVFEKSHANRDQIAEALLIDTRGLDDSGIAKKIIDTIIQIRNNLDLTSRLRDVDGMKKGHFNSIAKEIKSSDKMNRNPQDITLKEDEIIRILEKSW